MGMNSKALEMELKAIDSRMENAKNGRGKVMENLLNLKVEPVTEQESETPKSPLARRISQGVCKAGLHIGVEVLNVCALGVFLILGICVSLGMMLLAHHVCAPYLVPESPQEVITVIALGGVVLFTFWRETRRFEGILKGWMDGIHHRIERV